MNGSDERLDDCKRHGDLDGHDTSVAGEILHYQPMFAAKSAVAPWFRVDPAKQAEMLPGVRRDSLRHAERGNLMARTAPSWRRLTAALVPLAFFAPPTVAVLLSTIAFSNPIVPDLVLDTPKSDLPVTILVGLSQLMITMSAGLVVASTWVYRRPLRPTLEHWGTLLLVLAVTFAFISFYAGLRFMYDMAQQLRFTALDFDSLRNRMYWQGSALVLQVSTLSSHAVLSHLFKDGRSGPARK